MSIVTSETPSLAAPGSSPLLDPWCDVPVLETMVRLYGHDAPVPFPLGGMTLVLGRAASGKSTLLREAETWWKQHGLLVSTEDLNTFEDLHFYLMRCVRAFAECADTWGGTPAREYVQENNEFVLVDGLTYGLRRNTDGIELLLNLTRTLAWACPGVRLLASLNPDQLDPDALAKLMGAFGPNNVWMIHRRWRRSRRSPITSLATRTTSKGRAGGTGRRESKRGTAGEAMPAERGRPRLGSASCAARNSRP